LKTFVFDTDLQQFAPTPPWGAVAGIPLLALG